MLFRYFSLQLRFFYLWGGGLKIPVRVTEAEPKKIGVSLKASGELNIGKYVLEPCISAVGENTKITLLTNSPLKTKCYGTPAIWGAPFIFPCQHLNEWEFRLFRIGKVYEHACFEIQCNQCDFQDGTYAAKFYCTIMFSKRAGARDALY